jgi:hypothetical protein
METKVAERAKKQTGMQIDLQTYSKLETVLTSRQQVLRMEFVAKVKTDRTVIQAEG